MPPPPPSETQETLSQMRDQMRLASSSSNAENVPPPQLENVTDIIKAILDGYDIRLRPNFGGKRLC